MAAALVIGCVVLQRGKFLQPQKRSPDLRAARSSIFTPQLGQLGRQYSPSNATANSAACCSGVRRAI